MKRIFTILPVGLTLVPTDAERIQGLLEIFNGVVPCSKITFTLTSAIGIEPKIYRYKIEAVDSRIWLQHITFDNPSNPNMTFEVSSLWRLSEFSNQRNVRNGLVNLVPSYPTLEKLIYDFLG